MSLLNRLFGRSSTRRLVADAQHPHAIKGPRIAFVNLLGAEAESLLQEDRAALAGLFSESTAAEGTIPVCDVLVLYCQIDPKGLVSAAGTSLREIVRDSGAMVVLVATSNPVESYVASTKQLGYGRANLVMTLERRGTAFPRFFRELFHRMASGVTMPAAWVQLAPQGKGPHEQDAPSTMFACELGHVVFAPA